MFYVVIYEVIPVAEEGRRQKNIEHSSLKINFKQRILIEKMIMKGKPSDLPCYWGT